MSLFGFVKDIGNRVFNKDEDAAEKIRDHIQEAGVGIRNFEVVFDDGIAQLKGEVNTKADKEKAILLAGNVAGVADVMSQIVVKQDAPAGGSVAGAAGSAAPVDAPVGKEEETEFYVVKPGDTLGKIAKEYYGDAMQYPKIFEANKEVIKDPDLIFVGQKIRIPK
ncbi:MAG: peptidoglycan-binding protein LysM [Gammaproteobacteria bacterium]|nr:peptidoglycan-binding protein LysM [Gammaproteobacteria bacterium]NNC96826.1 peptidoglycan-binding protein LysM [Gammaproteobacteria bacterium]NNM12894.1 peptidoglycan-binding protein LysM [Gammaproteobacteria bacterium]